MSEDLMSSMEYTGYLNKKVDEDMADMEREKKRERKRKHVKEAEEEKKIPWYDIFAKWEASDKRRWENYKKDVGGEEDK